MACHESFGNDAKSLPGTCFPKVGWRGLAGSRVSADHVDGTAGKECLEVPGHDVDDALSGIGTGPCNVGRDEDVRGMEYGMVCRGRFLAEHIGAVGRQLSVGKGLCHIGIVDESATGGVDENQTSA